ncbi:hypothetical protein NK8_53460 (plasmid) [Caballeronia sp. NK8]|uniref:DUF6072 family protein n=1 Tax=Caballeronia sp. NK8 TaxID=140098 RepID=UPI001BB5B702|nr:DUF6072 family protein [Caballeronia sp. NK8]BCQ27157.1 hypothetical protein NK8_53460 [Caballeronia sp. NK8]
MKDNIAVAETPHTEKITSDTPAVVRSTSPATNGVKLVGEAFVPGASLLMDGNVVNGAAHVAAGIGIKMLFGPVGLLLAAADSYSKSVTDKYLWNHVSDLVDKAKETRRARAEAARPPAE